MRRALLSAVVGLVTIAALAASMMAASGTVLAVPRTVSVSHKSAADHSLAAIACIRRSDCWAVGDYGTNDVIYSSLAEHWNGSKWAVWKPPNPTSATALSGVSCVAASDCWAVGFASSGPPSDSDSPVAEYWDGTEWQAATPLSPSAFSSFDAIDCTSRTNCWDVGTSADLALIERWVDVTSKGPEWLLETTPNPRGATRSSLASVSCANASDCWAVGYYTNSSDVEETLAEHWTGTKWILTATPRPSRSTLSTLTGVACTGRTNCWAIGYYANSADLDKTLAEHWNGTKWQVKPTPNPSRSKLGVLNGIACARSANCTAIGYYARGSRIITLSEHWNGTKWKVKATPNPSGLTLSELNGIACPGLTDCWAVGDSGLAQQTPSRTLAEQWNGTKWKVKSTPNP